jgi:5-methyltetrahydrofolate--homocysteine methyltransferase
MNDALSDLKETLVGLGMDEIQQAVRRCLDAGIEPWRIIREGMSEGMRVVGEKFESGDYFLADLILAGETMKQGMELLKDRVEAAVDPAHGTIVLASVRGDIHDIGKNIVAMMLSAASYTIVDLGVDVPEERIVDELRRTGATLLGLSCLLTTTVPSVRSTIELLKRASMRDKVRVAIGGACTSDALAKELGADAHGRDAVQAVRIFQEFSRTAPRGPRIR